MASADRADSLRSSRNTFGFDTGVGLMGNLKLTTMIDYSASATFETDAVVAGGERIRDLGMH